MRYGPICCAEADAVGRDLECERARSRVSRGAGAGGDVGRVSEYREPAGAGDEYFGRVVCGEEGSGSCCSGRTKGDGDGSEDGVEGRGWVDRMLRVMSSGVTKAGDAGMFDEKLDGEPRAKRRDGAGEISGVLVGVTSMNTAAPLNAAAPVNSAAAMVKASTEHFGLLHVLVVDDD